MKGLDKIKLLKEILNDKGIMDEILKEEGDSEGKLVVEAEGSSPADAKEKMLKELESTKLPDEEEMGEIMPEMEEDAALDMEDEEDDESMLEDEDKDILEMLPEGTRKQFRRRLLAKLKNNM